MNLSASITLDANAVISPIDDRLYSSFIEHMGRAIYTGIYEPGHPASNEYGFREDVIDYIRPLNIPFIRYPGGNFVSGYRWEDGVGPKAARPVRPDLAWFALEKNQFGTNDFMDYLKFTGAKPMLAVNLGTRGAQDAANLLEYCNFPGGTYYSDLRISHGYSNPHNVKLWCLGNEMDGPWQICTKTAEEYGRLACETAKMMKWLDPQIELVACGSSFKEMPTFGDWERTVLRHTYEHVDYLSLHQYYMNTDNDLPSFLANNVLMDGFIKEVAAICAQIKAEKKSERDIYLSFDEWNVWYHFKKSCTQPPQWMEARPIEEEQYDFADALLVGSMLTTLINNADVVKIACLAQLINTIAPIMTEGGGGSWVQTTYYPFLYTSRSGRGTALRTKLDSPVYSCNTGKDIPFIDCASVLSLNGQNITVFIINKNLDKDIFCKIILAGFSCTKAIEWINLSGYAMDTVNTKSQSAVNPKKLTDIVTANGSISFKVPKASWNMIRFQIET